MQVYQLTHRVRAFKQLGAVRALQHHVFKYLQQSDITLVYRVRQVFRSLKANLFSSKRVGLGAKLKFYKSLVLPRLMYGAAESWALTEAQGAQLETFHNGCLRQKMGTTAAQTAPPPLSCWPALARPTWLTI